MPKYLLCTNYCQSFSATKESLLLTASPQPSGRRSSERIVTFDPTDAPPNKGEDGVSRGKKRRPFVMNFCDSCGYPGVRSGNLVLWEFIRWLRRNERRKGGARRCCFVCFDPDAPSSSSFKPPFEPLRRLPLTTTQKHERHSNASSKSDKRLV